MRATSVSFTGAEMHALDAALAAVRIQGQRQPPAVILLSEQDVFPWFGQHQSSAVLVAADPVLGPWLRAHYAIKRRIGRYYVVLARTQ